MGMALNESTLAQHFVTQSMQDETCNFLPSTDCPSSAEMGMPFISVIEVEREPLLLLVCLHIM